MASVDRWPGYEREIQRLRGRLGAPAPLAPYDETDGDEEPVQLSVRLSPRLRHDVAEVARRDGTTVTAFVTAALEEAVRVATDPFAGLAARMTEEHRSALRRSVERGAYAETAAEVDRAEGGDEPA